MPFLIGLFNFAALEAVILNKAASLVIVASALPFRAATVPFSDVAASWPIILNLLAGSLLGAWFGAGWATRLRSEALYKNHRRPAASDRCRSGVRTQSEATGHPPFNGPVSIFAGVIAGFLIGVLASLLGVAGGELLIPTLVLLFGADVKLAGSLSLAVSLPTMLVGFTRYSCEQSFSVLGNNKAFLLILAAGSIAGSFLGGLLLNIVQTHILLPLLATILVISAYKVWHHR